MRFLGSWCCSFSRRAKWSSLDSDICPYHWDDRKKLLKDYNALGCVYEQFLIVLANKLNELHGTSYSIRFWRILIGPWLYTCVQAVFDRWYMLKIAINSQELMNFHPIDNHVSFLVTDDMDAFNNAIESDEWNEALYSILVNFFFASNVVVKGVKSVSNGKPSNKNKQFIGFKSQLRDLCNTLSGFVSRDTDVFLIAPHMSFFKQVLLNIKLGQWPVLWFKSIGGKTSEGAVFDRETTTLSYRPGVCPDFEFVINKMLLRLIPRAYLEGFDSLQRLAKRQRWPKAPSTIFTSNSYASDEVFKFWAGDKIECGARLIIGQHGGNFGMTPMATHEIHQIKISDKWLSWGWSDIKEAKIVPVGNFKSKFTKFKHSPNGDALLVMMTLPKFSYYLYSVPIAGQIGSYFDDQLKFSAVLPKYIRRELRIRLYPVDRDWDQKGRWQSHSSDVSFDNASHSLNDSLRASRVFIGTYNATTFLETFAVNMPSILFWNPEHWEITTNSAYYFDKLKSVSVLHASPESAALHLEKIWENIDEWWFSAEVQDVINEFNNYYSMNNPKILNSMAALLKPQH